VTMHGQIDRQRRPVALALRLLAAGLLGVAVAIVLVSCGSSGKGLIPIANAGPLQSDFEAIAQAAQSGGGNCTATTEAINKTEQDFAALPATIDSGLHKRLSEGISNLREHALALCTQPLAQTATTTTPRTTTTTTTKTETTPTTPTTTTNTSTTPSTPAPVTPPNNGGGTVAPGESERSAEGRGNEQGESGGVAPGASGQEGGK
jgi:cell division septation protein DedD